MTGDPNDILIRKLKGFGVLRHRLAMVAAASTWLALAIVTISLYVAADWLLEPRTIPLLVLLGIAGVVVLALLAALVGRQLLRRRSIEGEALVAESLVGSLRNRLITALQMSVGSGEAERAGMNISSSLVAAVAEQSVKDLDEHRPDALLDRSTPWRRTASAAALVLLAAAFCAWRWEVIAERADRVRHAYVALIDIIWPVTAHVSPGDETVLRGSRVELGLRIEGRPFAQAVLHRSLATADGTRVLAGEPLNLEAGAAAFTTGVLEETFDYWFAYGERTTDPHRIRVVDRPALELLRVDLDYPAYTKRLPRTFMGRVPTIRGLEGTRVTLSLTYNKEIANAEAVWDGGAKEYWDVTGRYVGTEFIVTATDAVEVRVQCVDGYSPEASLRFTVMAEQDERPAVLAHVKSPRSGNIMLTAEQLPLFSVGFTATDDFGVASVALKYEKTGTDVDLATDEAKGHIPMLFRPAREKAVAAFQKCFADLAVQPGDKITFYLEATDNRDVGGETPNIGRTPRKYSVVIYQPRMTAFLDEKLRDWSEGLRLWGDIERAGEGRQLGMPPVKRRLSQSPDIAKQDLDTSVAAERVPGANRQAEAQFRELLARPIRENGGEE